jgi:hypothetical protein
VQGPILEGTVALQIGKNTPYFSRVGAMYSLRYFRLEDEDAVNQEIGFMTQISAHTHSFDYPQSEFDWTRTWLQIYPAQKQTFYPILPNETLTVFGREGEEMVTYGHATFQGVYVCFKPKVCAPSIIYVVNTEKHQDALTQLMSDIE